VDLLSLFPQLRSHSTPNAVQSPSNAGTISSATTLASALAGKTPRKNLHADSYYAIIYLDWKNLCEK
jgi:hypothetical protein